MHDKFNEDVKVIQQICDDLLSKTAGDLGLETPTRVNTLIATAKSIRDSHIVYLRELGVKNKDIAELYGLTAARTSQIISLANKDKDHD